MKRTTNMYGSNKMIRKINKDRDAWSKVSQRVRDRKSANQFKQTGLKAQKIKNYQAKQRAKMLKEKTRNDLKLRQYQAETERMVKAGKIEMAKTIGNQVAKNLAPATSTFGIQAANNLISNGSEIADKNITQRKPEDDEQESTDDSLIGTNPFRV